MLTVFNINKTDKGRSKYILHQPNKDVVKGV